MTAARSEERSPRQALPRHWFGRPAVRQHSEMDCGAACLSTIAAFYGKKVSINRMRDLARVDREGSTLANLRRAANAIGFDTRTVECPTDQLTARGLPAIVNWKGYHWIVVYNVGPRRVLVADPARGLTTLPRAEFDEHFAGYCLLLSPNSGFDDLHDDVPALTSIAKYFAPLRMQIAEVLLASLAAQIITVSIPLFAKFIIDDVIMQGNQNWLLVALIGMFGLTIMQIVISWVRQELTFAISLKADLSLVYDMYDRLVRLPVRFFHARKSGDITTRLSEQQKITDFMTSQVTDIVVNVMAVFIYIALMAWFSVTLTLVAVSFTVFYILVVRLISPRLRVAYGEAFEKGAERESHVIETLRGLETVKSIGAGAFIRWRFDDLYASFANTNVRIMGLSVGAATLVGFVTQLAMIAVLFAGATMVMGGEMSIGVLVAFTMFAAALFEPMNALVEVWDELQEALNAVERVNDILDKEPEIKPMEDQPNLIHMPRPRGGIRFERLAFRYNPDDPANVLQNINLSVAPGEKVAFVGRSGCGKSTILRLLFGMHAPTDGRIMIDGYDLADVWLPSLRQHIGCVPQKPAIFAGSIRDNISLARPSAPRRDVIEAAKLADAAGFIAERPGGYDALLEEHGANLSGGQRQRIALARLFLQNPAIVLLDEATSALDTTTEATIMSNIAQRFASQTVLIVAHRLSTIQQADRIVVLNRGLIVEEGTHGSLMESGGLYRRLQSRESIA